MLRACRMMGCPRIVRVGDTHVMHKTYTQEDVRLYASLIGDLNPIHQNIEAAKKAGFTNCVVHGMLVASLFSTSMGMYLPGPQSVYLHQAVDFTAPVIVGDPLEITVRVKEFHKSRSLILLETTVEKPKEGGGKIVCVKGQGLGMNKAVTLEGESVWTFTRPKY